MAAIKVNGKDTKRGQKMTKGKCWRLINLRGNTMFSGALLHTFRINGHRLAVFNVWKGDR